MQLHVSLGKIIWKTRALQILRMVLATAGSNGIVTGIAEEHWAYSKWNESATMSIYGTVAFSYTIVHWLYRAENSNYNIYCSSWFRPVRYRGSESDTARVDGVIADGERVAQPRGRPHVTDNDGTAKPTRATQKNLARDCVLIGASVLCSRLDVQHPPLGLALLIACWAAGAKTYVLDRYVLLILVLWQILKESNPVHFRPKLLHLTAGSGRWSRRRSKKLERDAGAKPLLTMLPPTRQ